MKSYIVNLSNIIILKFYKTHDHTFNLDNNLIITDELNVFLQIHLNM